MGEWRRKHHLIGSSLRVGVLSVFMGTLTHVYVLYVGLSSAIKLQKYCLCLSARRSSYRAAAGTFPLYCSRSSRVGPGTEATHTIENIWKG